MEEPLKPGHPGRRWHMHSWLRNDKIDKVSGDGCKAWNRHSEIGRQRMIEGEPLPLIWWYSKYSADDLNVEHDKHSPSIYMNVLQQAGSFKKAPAARVILEFVPRNLIRQKSIVSRCGACPCHSLVPGVNCPVIWRCMAGMALLVSVVPDNKKSILPEFIRTHLPEAGNA
ncbi:hypothetical protein VFPPC_17712 [Pochonia chlamydosporia 170]|uniref:Uncharacterized protein n=1 Tax=Pochonia chlamydosporia 170 TaxID=1380566 RepID=A0A219AR86_METCM|nr:hypothetical protein VFPPC_17712 [Pochonia chlamydosporia 170]OWT43112.1 hypothetical protein VFPPC_17712 [Pochonia chlamydosporia 170]